MFSDCCGHHSDIPQGIKEEFSQFGSIDIPENVALRTQNLDIWEVLQPEENLENNSDFFDGQKNARWITVEPEDAGDEEEKVLFRTFVNAGIGGKKFRMRTKGAPYMLLLSTRDGESEPKVTICNQSGTLCLQRDCKSFIVDCASQSNTLSRTGRLDTVNANIECHAQWNAWGKNIRTSLSDVRAHERVYFIPI